MPSITDQLLLNHLDSRAALWDPARTDSLELRKRAELEFHNLDREVESQEAAEEQKKLDLYANRKWYAVTRSSRQYVDAWLKREVVGKVFLDYACGNGQMALRAAECGARLAVGLDISDVSIRNARRAAQAAGVSQQCRFIQGDCENTELPDASIDRIICSGMLHHLDLDKAYPELQRILAPGGKILCIEALAHNPLIRLYRTRTPHLRTAWEAEHILRVEDIIRARAQFRLGETRFWHLLSLAVVPLRDSVLFPPLLKMAELADRAVLGIPGIQKWAWQSTFELLHRAGRP